MSAFVTYAPSEVRALPDWNDAVAGAPVDLLRCALFTITSSNKSVHQRKVIEAGELEVDDVEWAKQMLDSANPDADAGLVRDRLFVSRQTSAWTNLEVLYTGPLLDQKDLSVWLECLHLSRKCLGHCVGFTTREMTQATSGRTGGSARANLDASLSRLVRGTITLKRKTETGVVKYEGHLLLERVFDEATGRHVVQLSPALAALFDMPPAFLNRDVRRALSGSALALWLYGFYCTHEKPKDFSIEAIRRYCGSRANKLYAFRRQVKEALALLQSVTGWRCALTEEDEVQVDRKAALPTISTSEADPLVRTSPEYWAAEGALRRSLAQQAVKPGSLLAECIRTGEGSTADELRRQLALLFGTSKLAKTLKRLEATYADGGWFAIAEQLETNFVVPAKGSKSRYQVLTDSLKQVRYQ